MSRRGRKPSPEDVLRGRVSIDVHGLVALIHRVNPTGRALPARDEARAYATKAALQSLLLRRFPEHVRVEESAPGVIALSLRETGQHAAHCPIDALDEDVRSRVRFVLDAGEEHEIARSERGAERTRGWAARSREALERYDYEEAETILRAACASAPDDVAPRVALMELLVDQLGNPPAALALWASLDRALRADRRIAGATAVAAALGGELALARELLPEISGERVTEVWAHLAQAAMRDDDEELAREAREALDALSPAHPLIRTLDDHLEAQRLSARGRAEAQLLAAQADGLEPGALARMAEALLARYPRSPIAARVLRALELAATQARIDELLARAEEHAPHDDAAAAAAWREAIALGADASSFEARLRAAEDRVRAERVARAAEEIVASFETDVGTGLARALDAEADVLDAARALLDAEPLDMLARAERIARASSSARAKACARAALAWEEAERAVAEGDGATAARLLARHAKLLEPIAEAAALRERLERIEQGERRAAAASALESARDAFLRGELGEARRCLGRTRAADLDDRAAYDALAAELEQKERERAFEATMDRHEREGRWLDVVAACEGELAREEAPERRRDLAERLTRARAQVHDAYRFAVLPVEGGDLPPFGRDSTVTKAIGDRADGVLVAVTGAAGWIIIRWFDPCWALKRVACMRPPDATSTAHPISVHAGERITITTSDEVAYSLARTGDAVARALEFRTTHRDKLYLVGSRPFAWQLDSPLEVTRIFDARTGQEHRRLPHAQELAPLPHLSLVLVCGCDAQGFFIEPYHARGLRAGPRIPMPGSVTWVEGNSSVLYLLCEKESGASGPSRSLVRVDRASGACTTLLELDVDEATQSSLAISSDALFLCHAEHERAVLDAYATGERDELELRWTMPFSCARLVQAGPSTFALLPDARRQALLPLSLTPPQIDLMPPIMRLGEGTLGLPALSPLTPAAERLRPPDERARDALPLTRIGREAILRLVRDGDEAAMSETLDYFSRRRSELSGLLEAIRKRLSFGPTLTAWVAKHAMDQRRWQDATAAIDSLERTPLEDTLEAWCCYARGVVAYGTGGIEQAIEHWRRARGETAPAQAARALIERVRELHGESGPAAPDDGHRALLGAIRAADERAAAGDLDGAITLLDHQLVWRAGEEQAFARLAAWRMELGSDAEWLRTLEVLAEFVLLPESPFAMVLAVPGAHWAEERIGDVRERARRWLDEARPPQCAAPASR